MYVIKYIWQVYIIQDFGEWISLQHKEEFVMSVLHICNDVFL